MKIISRKKLINASFLFLFLNVGYLFPMDPALGKVMHDFNQIPYDVRPQIIWHLRESNEEFQQRLFEEQYDLYKQLFLNTTQCSFIKKDDIEDTLGISTALINKETKKIDFYTDKDYLTDAIVSYDRQFCLLYGFNVSEGKDTYYFSIYKIGEIRKVFSKDTADYIFEKRPNNYTRFACSNNGKLIAIYIKENSNNFFLVYRKKASAPFKKIITSLTTANEPEVKKIDFNLQDTALGIVAEINGKKHIAIVPLKKEPRNLKEYFEAQDPSDLSELDNFVLTDDHFEPIE